MKYDPRKHTQSYLGVKEKPVTRPLPKDENRSVNLDLLNKAQGYYTELEPKRRIANENWQRFIGKGLKQKVKLEDGSWTTMENAISMQGRIPVNNNLVYSIIMTVIGNWSQNKPKPSVVAFEKDKQQEAEMLTMALEESYQNNQGALLDLEQFKNMLIKEITCGKMSFGMNYETATNIAKMENVPMQNVFFNTDITDPRTNKGINFCGDFTDSTLDTVIAAYASSRSDGERIAQEYASLVSDTQENKMDDRIDDESFSRGVPNGKVRVFNIWYEDLDFVIDKWDKLAGKRVFVPYSKAAKEAIEQENKDMKLQAMQAFAQDGMPEDQMLEALKSVPTIKAKDRHIKRWKYKIITPNGATLKSGVTPYAHGSHPYSFSMLDIGVVTAIAPLVDYFDRLYSLFDFIINNSAKGLTIISEESLEAAGMSAPEVMREARKANGVIVLPTKALAGKAVEQLSSNNTNIGISEMMTLTLDRIQQVGGVSGALAGQTPNSGTPASQYAQEAQNSATNLVYYYEKFRNYMETRDMKNLKNIVQFTNEDKEVNVTGESGLAQTTYKVDAAKNLNFDVRILEGNSTPLYRQMQEVLLNNLFDKQVIDEEMYLSNSSAPFSDKLLEQIKARKEQAQDAQKGTTQQEGDPMGQEGAQQGAVNPESMKMLDQYMGAMPSVPQI